MKTVLSFAFLYIFGVGTVAAAERERQFARQRDAAEMPVAPNTEYKTWRGPLRAYLGKGGSKPNLSYAVPVYFEYPARHYYVIGVVVEHGAQSGYKQITEAAALRSMARAAQIRGADAIVLRPLTPEVRAQTNSMSKRPWVFAYAAAIKFGKPPERDPTIF